MFDSSHSERLKYIRGRQPIKNMSASKSKSFSELRDDLEVFLNSENMKGNSTRNSSNGFSSKEVSINEYSTHSLPSFNDSANDSEQLFTEPQEQDSDTTGRSNSSTQTGHQPPPPPVLAPTRPFINSRSTETTGTSSYTDIFPLGPTFYFCLGVIVVFVAIFLVKNATNVAPTSDSKSCTAIFSLKDKYKSQNEDIWYDFKFGIESVMKAERSKPNIYMLIYDQKADINNLLQDVISVAYKCINPSARPVIKSADYFKTPDVLRDYGEAISKLKVLMEKSHVMLITKFNEIPPLSARAFHTICDTETPFVDKAFVILAMPVDSNLLDGKKPTAKAEITLRNLWKDAMKRDIMDPLIARVTDNVLYIN